MTPEQSRLLEAATIKVKERESHDRLSHEATQELHAIMVEARNSGVSVQELMDATGLGRSGVYHVLAIDYSDDDSPGGSS